MSDSGIKGPEVPAGTPAALSKLYLFLVIYRNTVKLPSIFGSRSATALGLAAVPMAGALGTALGVLSPMAQAGPPAKPQEILLVSYAVTKAAYHRIIPQFTADWKRKPARPSPSAPAMAVAAAKPAL